jgi:thiol-disulfide isomerase/thioredoxin
MSTTTKMLTLAATLACAIGAPTTTLAEDITMVQQASPRTTRLPIEGDLPSLDGATGWLNSPPLTPAGLRGKVVLVDFWTYTCINWLRSLPYVRAWADKYKDQGVVVIGVHAPEFTVEHDTAGVARAAKALKVEYPIAVDNDYAIWRAFDNNYWPALYIADAQGRIRYHHFGEGAYAESERAIQQLLAEAGRNGVGHDLVAVDARGAEASADWGSLKSAENYVGYARTENFASRVRIDGQPPGPAHGIDVDDQGSGTVTEPRLYQLIRQRGAIADGEFEIEFLDPGVEVLAFTFG